MSAKNNHYKIQSISGSSAAMGWICSLYGTKSSRQACQTYLFVLEFYCLCSQAKWNLNVTIKDNTNEKGVIYG